MKIIDKYKDFYDWFVVDNDPHNTFVRTKPYLIENEDKDIYNILMQCGILDHNLYRYMVPSKGKSIPIDVQPIIFGIYPKVYSVPVFLFKRGLSLDYFIGDEKFYKHMKSYKKIDVFRMEVYHQFVLSYLSDNLGVNVKCIDYWLSNTKKIVDKYKSVECPDVFNKIGSPTFIIFDSGVAKHIYHKDRNTIPIEYLYKEPILYKLPWLIGNVNFNRFEFKIYNAFESELLDINTYNRIENALYMLKREPISEPSNDIKVQIAGFDNVDSFRNTNNRLKRNTKKKTK